jgi:aerobic-type carbon monoxide dehydrogenase small subunit (CoxS/CutS family)
MSRDEKKKELEIRRSGAISRREFAKESAVMFGIYSGGAALSMDTAPTAEAHPALAAPPVSQAAQTIRFAVNGWHYELQVEPEWALREVLRDRLGFLSIKDMCNGHGACGSCTVIMNGRPVLSCMTLAVECDGAKIETAESIASANPELVEAYVMNHCMQCGYCTPGFIMSAKALLDRIPRPTEEDIRDALGGNICRCGTYPQHILAIREAAGHSAG